MLHVQPEQSFVIMSAPAMPAWSDGEIPLNPGGAGAKTFQRIFPKDFSGSRVV
jgi:hypothetical protein